MQAQVRELQQEPGETTRPLGKLVLQRGWGGGCQERNSNTEQLSASNSDSPEIPCVSVKSAKMGAGKAGDCRP